MNMKGKLVAVAVAAAFAPLSAFATNGYFSHGFGVKALGMGGVGIALPQDALAAATNPAGMAFVGDRLDVGVTWFRPDRGAEIVGPGPDQSLGGINGSFDGNGKKNFFIPEFGINKMVTPDAAVGVSVFGNGGLNTQYDGGIALFNGRSFPTKTGVDLMQLFVSPTMAFKINPQHSIGVSLNLVYQRFKAEGLQAFDQAGVTETPGSLTDQDYDNSRGASVRVGWTGEVLPGLTLGATYQTKTKMTNFSKYKGLFAEQGDFDIPENYGIGVAWKVMPALTIAADVQQINYSKVRSIGNSISNLNLLAGGSLGSSNGPGFGWRDMTVYKLGASFDVSSNLTVRAGYAYGRQPIPDSETLFNILAPGTIEQHATLGGTWKIDPKQEVSAYYLHAFKKTVNGNGSFNALAANGFPIPPGTEANIHNEEDALGVAYGLKF